MADKHGDAREHPEPTTATVKRLYANALWCAKPGCREPLYKAIGQEQKEELNSRVAHIHARRLGGPRWLPGMPSSANRGYKNLVILCLFDADAVDRSEADFPAQMLRDWKQAHEAEVRRLGGAKPLPLSDEQLAQVMARSFAPVVDAVREVVPFSARSRTRARTLERARALSRARSLARLTPVPATLRERVLEWATGSQVLDVAVPAGSVRIVVAPMGSGKSEIAESWWRDGLREAEHDEAIEVPVWIEARQAAACGLEQSVIDAIGGDPIRPCRVVVDDLEGVGAAEARLLLKQARQLAAASPCVSVLATARPGAVAIEDRDEQIIVPEWSVERGLALLNLVAPDVAPHEWWAEETRDLLKRPLTALALGVRLLAGGDARVTRSSLLGELAGLIVERERPDADEQTWARLVKLAASILQNRGAVRASTVGPPPVVWRLSSTGLVVEHGGDLSFALPVFEQYFGAQAITSGVMPLAEAARAPAFERWRYAIASVVAAGTPAQAELDMAEIARIDAAAASWVFDEIGSREDFGRAGQVLSEADVRATLEAACPALSREADLSIAVGRWLREPVEALLEGFGPVRTLLGVHRDGKLCQWGVGCQGGHVLLAKSSSRVEPALVRVDDPDRDALRAAGWERREWFSLPTGGLARWRWARRQVRRDLGGLLVARRLPTRPGSTLTRERIWYLAVYVTTGRFRRDLQRIPLVELREKLAPLMEQVHSSVLFRCQWPGYTADSQDFRWLDEQLRHLDGDMLERPWPAPDSPNPLRGSIALGYSARATVPFVAAVMQAAMEGYRELVEINLPSCAASLATYALLPGHVRGLIQRFEGEHEFSSSVHYLMMPGEGAADVPWPVEIELVESVEAGSESHFAALFERGAERIPKGSISLSSDLPMNWARPASNYAYQWLINDLEKVGWLEKASVGFFD